MEEDILKYSPTVMFRGTPCSSQWQNYQKLIRLPNCRLPFTQFIDLMSELINITYSMSFENQKYVYKRSSSFL